MCAWQFSFFTPAKKFVEKRLLLISVLLNIFFSANAQSVNVVSGSADGNFTKGKTFYILANPCPAGFVFNKWTGNVKIADTFSVNTSFSMPSKDVKLTATYKPAAVWSPVIDTINGSQVYYYFPNEKIKGLITFYHGSGGSASNWFLDEFEKPFLQYAVEEGYAVFTTQSKDRIKKQWDVSGAESADIQNVKIILSKLKSRGLITNKTKILGIGMSDGSQFCSLISAVDSFAANALYCSSGIKNSISSTTSPTEWCIPEDDTTYAKNLMESAQNNFDLLQSRGIGAQFLIRKASPVFPLLFWHAWGLDSNDSKIIYNSLKKNKAINDEDFITLNPLNQSKWNTKIPSQYLYDINNIGGELTAAAAEHRFQNYFESRTLSFFDKYTKTKSRTTSVNDPPIIEDKLFPNPAENYFSVQSKTTITSVKIYSATGFLIKQFSPERTNVQFLCTDLTNGIYFIQVEDANGNLANEKLIVRH
jgi:hypothetical protein